jgi:hypothetical protein
MRGISRVFGQWVVLYDRLEGSNWSILPCDWLKETVVLSIVEASLTAYGEQLRLRAFFSFDKRPILHFLSPFTSPIYGASGLFLKHYLSYFIFLTNLGILLVKFIGLLSWLSDLYWGVLNGHA